jgi:hypothetical protein
MHWGICVVPACQNTMKIEVIYDVETVIIYDQVGQEDISFLVVPGDVSHLHGTYINYSSDYENIDELDKLIYKYNEKGEYIGIKPRLTEFPVDAVKRGAKVIVCGFMPP